MHFFANFLSDKKLILSIFLMSDVWIVMTLVSKFSEPHYVFTLNVEAKSGGDQTRLIHCSLANIDV